jgi:hypothetical protein
VEKLRGRGGCPYPTPPLEILQNSTSTIQKKKIGGSKQNGYKQNQTRTHYGLVSAEFG